jgi:hypothetical protein
MGGGGERALERARKEKNGNINTKSYCKKYS